MSQVPADMARALDEVVEQWAASGPDLGIAEVSVQTGIPRSTLYYYFSGQNDLIAYLASTAIDAIRQLVSEALDAPGSEDERLRRVLEAQVHFLSAKPQLTMTLLTNLSAAGDLRALTARANAAFHRPVERLLMAGRSSGLFTRVTNPETVASALFGAMLITAAHYLVVDGTVDPERLTLELLPVLMEGLG